MVSQKSKKKLQTCLLYFLKHKSVTIKGGENQITEYQKAVLIHSTWVLSIKMVYYPLLRSFFSYTDEIKTLWIFSESFMIRDRQ